MSLQHVIALLERPKAPLGADQQVQSFFFFERLPVNPFQPSLGDGVVLDSRFQQALDQLDLSVVVRALGVEPDRVVVLPELQTEEPVTLEQLRDGPLGPMLQAAAATAVAMGAAAQRVGDSLRQQATADVEALRTEAERAAQLTLASAREQAARIQSTACAEAEQVLHEAQEDAARTKMEARTRAYRRRSSARLHAAVEDHQKIAPVGVRRVGQRQVVVDQPTLEWEKIQQARPRLYSPHTRAQRDGISPPRRGRTALASISVLALVLGGLALAQHPHPSLDALRLGDAAALGSPQPVEVLADRLRLRTERAGPVGYQLVGAIDQMQALPIAARRNRAIGLANDIEAAVRNGRLTPETERLVRPALIREATPPDLKGLVALLAIRPLGAGPDGADVLAQARLLSASPGAQRSRSFMHLVRSSADTGRLSSAFRVVAAAVLEEHSKQ